MSPPPPPLLRRPGAARVSQFQMHNVPNLLMAVKGYLPHTLSFCLTVSTKDLIFGIRTSRS